MQPKIVKNQFCLAIYPLIFKMSPSEVIEMTITAGMAKFVAAQQAGLTPVLCIGETQTERESGNTEAVLADQLSILEGMEIER